MVSKRVQSTADLTALAISWLFVRRKCRVICDEMGLGGFGEFTPYSLWRGDVAGIARLGRDYRFDLVEVKGSRADARREDMSRGKWELLARGKKLNLWLLVSHDCRPEDYEGLPVQWGVLRASEDATTLRCVRRPQGDWSSAEGRLVSASEAAPGIFSAATRTLLSRLPYLGQSVSSGVLALHEQAQKVEEAPPLPPPIPVEHHLDEVRLYRTIIFTPGLSKETVVPVLGVDGSHIGFANVEPVGEDRSKVDLSIRYDSADRLLAETKQTRFSIGSGVVKATWATDDGQS